jgi:hypothetical protein
LDPLPVLSSALFYSDILAELLAFVMLGMVMGAFLVALGPVFRIAF